MSGLPLGTTSELVGLVGALVYIGAYFAMQLGLLAGQSYLYAGLNIVAAGCVLVSLRETFNLSSALIQTVWIAISVVGIARLGLVSLAVRFTPEEKAFLAARFPALSKPVARGLVRGGLWLDGAPGTVLTVEGEAVESLIYLARGDASVLFGSRVVGHCGAGSFIGEVTCLSGDPATATVRLMSPARYFAIGAPRLRQLCRRNPELRQALEAGFSSDIRRKLALSNRAHADSMPLSDVRRGR
jgi:CRP-like cAMP-binding protein